MANKSPVQQKAMEEVAQNVQARQTWQIERQGNTTQPTSRRYPKVVAGTCEYCGTIDPNVPGEYQYQLCPHYKGKELQCSYCPQGKDSDDVNRKATLKVYDHPSQPNTVIVVCDNYECEKAHQARFIVSGR